MFVMQEGHSAPFIRTYVDKQPAKDHCRIMIKLGSNQN